MSQPGSQPKPKVKLLAEGGIESRVDMTDIHVRLSELEASINSLSFERAEFAKSESARIHELITSIVSIELAQQRAEAKKMYARIESLSESINQKLEVFFIE
jgi:hypothetical protein